MIIRNKIQLRLVCLTVGLTHLVLVLLRLYERIWELIILEEPFIYHEHRIIIVSYIVQILTISLLIYGCRADSPNFTVPWLVITTPIFILSTLYGVLVLFKDELSQTSYNIFSICSVWLMWYFVLKYNLKQNTLIGGLLKHTIYKKYIISLN
ncbi:unnamed protein product [Psylliodes chrysocephalus]|uniref:Uncharacterized protein n=1 Tax=Psylliodes chrysocephalus TaxID=3402493 RepID=A0A9P0CD92_9CUCU|nr:unnamed protein product [Psylliodes chrysocephala]